MESGYSGGAVANPSYEMVSQGDTGHAEVIRVTYDPAIISYEDLLTVFFGTHDPTTPNRQGNDVGTQYRSVLFFGDDLEKETAEMMIRDINASLTDGTHVVTNLYPSMSFYPAESFHRNYFKTNRSAPYCELIIEPKIEKLRTRFAALLSGAAK